MLNGTNDTSSGNMSFTLAQDPPLCYCNNFTSSTIPKRPCVRCQVHLDLRGSAKPSSAQHLESRNVPTTAPMRKSRRINDNVCKLADCCDHIVGYLCHGVSFGIQFHQNEILRRRYFNHTLVLIFGTRACRHLILNRTVQSGVVSSR